MKRVIIFSVVFCLAVPAPADAVSIFSSIDRYHVGNVDGFGLNRYSRHNKFCHDFNGDGLCDLAFIIPCAEGDTDIRFAILIGNSDGTFQPPWNIFISADSPCDMGIPIAMDYDGDGQDDFVVPDLYGSLIAGINNGEESWPTETLSVISSEDYNPLPIWGTCAACDCNSDGMDEIVAIADDEHCSVVILKSDGSGTYTDTYYQETLCWGFDCAGTGDFNGDGIEDVLHAHSYGGINVLVNDDECGFQKFGSCGSLSNTAVIGDFNGDGLEDFLYEDEWSFHPETGKWYGTVIFGGTDSLHTGPIIDYYVSDSDYLGDPLVGDFNGDGMDDIGIVRKRDESGLNPVYIRYSEGDTFTAVQDTVLLETSYSTAGTDYGVYAEDLNGDGYDELLYMCTPDTLAVLINQPVATTLQSLNSSFLPEMGVVLEWKASVTGDNSVFIISRKNASESSGVSSPIIIGKVRASSSRAAYSFTDTGAEIPGGETVIYSLKVSENGAEARSLGMIRQDLPALSTTLLQNYPNPFNPSTTIEFILKEPGPVSLDIYNVSGQLVRRLMDSRMTKGRHRVQWDGMNHGGKPVSSGVYFCRLRTGKEIFTSEVVIVR